MELVVSEEIVEEYRRAGDELSKQYPNVDIEPFLELLAVYARVVEAAPLEEQICSDPDDDKFFAYAIASRCKVICSGDKALLKTSGYRGIRVLTPRQFAEEFLKRKR